MSVRVNQLAAFTLVPILGAGVGIAAQPPSAPAVPAPSVKAAPAKGAKASLALDVSALKPGSTATLAIVFDIAPKWHIYWDGINDSGQPPKIVEKKLPEGVTLGDIRWPAPARHVLAGDIVDHVYETRVVLLVPVTLAKSAKVGEKLAIELSLQWMECANECRMGTATLETSLLVAEATKASTEAKMIVAAELLVPKAIGPKDGLTVVLENGVLKLAAKDADAIAFFPAQDSAPPKDRVAGCEGKGPALEVAMEAGSAQPAKGIVSVRKGKETRSFTIETPTATSTKQNGHAGERKVDPR